MATMNVSLPAELKQYVDERANCGSYGSSSEYVRELIRGDQARERLRAMILEGANSPVAAQADKQFFADLRERLGVVRAVHDPDGKLPPDADLDLRESAQ